MFRKFSVPENGVKFGEVQRTYLLHRHEQLKHLVADKRI